MAGSGPEWRNALTLIAPYALSGDDCRSCGRGLAV